MGNISREFNFFKQLAYDFKLLENIINIKDVLFFFSEYVLCIDKPRRAVFVCHGFLLQPF